MKNAEEYRKAVKGSSALENKYNKVLNIIHKELELVSERGLSIANVEIPVCEDDVEEFRNLFYKNGYIISMIFRCPAWGKADTNLVKGKNVDWYDATIYF